MPEFKFDAVVFDLDGVITQTASVHSAAWKQMFDEFLREYAEQSGEPFREFTHNNDYLPFVDGKPRFDGVAAFLKSRNIDLPFGDPQDDPGKNTICGLGNRKNEIFNRLIDEGNLVIFDSTVDFIKELLKNGVKVGVASSSKNCEKILKAAGLIDFFETIVDGLVSARLGLKGKPHPDIFKKACDNMGVDYHKAIIVEDAVSGVQAGQNGQFGLVVGVARENNEMELRLNGADIVVSDLAEISLNDLNNWFTTGLQNDQWTLTYFNYDPEKEGTREALHTVGNGYMGTRGALEETKANGINYPGTYLAGLYNRLTSIVSGREVQNEDFVNCPNWLPLTFKIANGQWLDLNKVEIIVFERRLDFRDGSLYRKVIVKDNKGRETLIQSVRFISMAKPHLAALKYTITPLNYNSDITIRSELDGQVINGGVKRYSQLNSKHWETIDQGGEKEKSFLVVRTNQSKIKLAVAARLFIKINGQPVNSPVEITTDPGSVKSTLQIKGKKNTPLTVEKIVAIYTSKEEDHPKLSAENEINQVNSFEELYNESKKAWSKIWKKIDIQLEGQRLTQKLVRLNLYHLMITASPHNAQIDAGIPARGLHGEAYRGHIFWDELFILPIYFMHFPRTARSVLMYRYRRLDQARAYAAEHGYQGAMFPWQSGSDGREETQTLHLNPLSGKWDDDYSRLQRHVSLAIAYNIFNYYQFTGDLKFLSDYGAEMFLEICRFWASKADFESKSGRYNIDGVMGPDEYHEAYPGANSGGLKNNSYTNIMVLWAIDRAFNILDLLPTEDKMKLFKKIDLNEKELDEWRNIKNHLSIPLSRENILEQFEGFFDLKEIDLKEYARKYRNISRMDRILKAEGKNPNDYKVIKQADTLMTFYNLHENEIHRLLIQAGFMPSEQLLKKNFDYYIKYTSHGSTLSKLVHSRIAFQAGYESLSYNYFMESLKSDFHDVQGGTTKEGIHTGVMAGSVLLILKNYAGLHFKDDKIYLEPNLPAGWRGISFWVRYQKQEYHIKITHKKLKITKTSPETKIGAVYIKKNKIHFGDNKYVEIEL
ncbi:beta-phosphoglucomutase family hydrolase [Caldithrix abyssi]|uniref:Beta-phosphoglucomutase family hydrolase n=1 Tax=Caldithrix abyssi DSM 13497 TaxID=880073 RepID=H1XSN4_CALAY|nr:beta-phosphoglucomutase family hydrolase [Caldithrix abyssi]APF18594.1 haloacid dehalogenase superfamily, subfamily IA, variant 3 with third motif having DD or ED/beta-phosphoglucomutase family hydrolase [Caldithrix abyssi DSM 13497]EHO42582.1 beta-phosphoglucomutase family hydrolase [Caldithrix abyssi DSM 13497]